VCHHHHQHHHTSRFRAEIAGISSTTHTQDEQMRLGEGKAQRDKGYRIRDKGYMAKEADLNTWLAHQMETTLAAFATSQI